MAYDGTVLLKLRSGEYKLRLDLHACCKAEEATGLKLNLQNPFESGVRAVVAMLWASLLHAKPELTLEEAGRIAAYDELPEVQRAIVATMNGGELPEFPKDETAEKNV